MGRGRGRSPAGGELTVLQSFRSPGPQTNPYLVQLRQSTSAQVRVVCFSWRAALLGRYDVFHVHWPEVLLRGSSPGRTAGRQALFLVLLVRLAWQRVAVVRTVHNLAPHEAAAPSERVLQWLLDRSTTLWVRLNDSTALPPGAVRTIPHGHYRDWFSGFPRPGPTPGRLLHFGLLRPYKGVEMPLRPCASSVAPRPTRWSPASARRVQATRASGLGWSTSLTPSWRSSSGRQSSSSCRPARCTTRARSCSP